MTTRRDPLIVAADIDADGRLHLDLPAPQHRALLRARFAEQRVDVEVRLRKTRRSDRQNRALHAAWKGWSDFLGYPVDELKREMLALVFGTEEKASPVTGELRHVLVQPHTSQLTTAQFAELMDRAVQVAAETGYLLELPDEWQAKKEPRRPAEHGGARASAWGGSRAAGMTPAPRWDERHARAEGRTLDAAASEATK